MTTSEERDCSSEEDAGEPKQDGLFEEDTDSFMMRQRELRFSGLPPGLHDQHPVCSPFLLHPLVLGVTVL